MYNGPGPLNITFESDMPITLLYLMLMSKIYVVNSDMKNVICMSDPNVMFKGPGPLNITCYYFDDAVAATTIDFKKCLN